MTEVKDKVLSGSIFIILLLLIGCTDSNNIKGVRIFYLPQNLNVMIPISSCDEIFYHSDMLRDTIIYDNIFIDKFNKAFSTLNVAMENDSVFDFRIRCEIKTNNDSIKVMCLGEFFDIVYDGSLYEDNSELLKLVKETVYNKPDKYSNMN